MKAALLILLMAQGLRGAGAAERVLPSVLVYHQGRLVLAEVRGFSSDQAPPWWRFWDPRRGQVGAPHRVLWVFDPGTRSLARRSPPAGDFPPTIRCLASHEGRLYAGGYGGLSWSDDPALESWKRDRAYDGKIVNSLSWDGKALRVGLEPPQDSAGWLPPEASRPQARAQVRDFLLAYFARWEKDGEQVFFWRDAMDWLLAAKDTEALRRMYADGQPFGRRYLLDFLKARGGAFADEMLARERSRP